MPEQVKSFAIFSNLFALFFRFQQKQPSIQSKGNLSASSLILRWHRFLFFEAKNSFTEASISSGLLKCYEHG